MHVTRLKDSGSYVALPKFNHAAEVPGTINGRYHIGEYHILSSAWIEPAATTTS
jgi:hypothetical protein